VTYRLKSRKPLITLNLLSASALKTLLRWSPPEYPWQIPSAKIRGRSVALSLAMISSILNCKATRQHSPLSGALLYAEDFTLHLDWKASDFIGDSL
jgi:hypothetical protein